jgi:outer membrane lipoprotein carrier protein
VKPKFVIPKFDKLKLLDFVNYKCALQALLLTASLQASAGSLESLESFLKTAHSGRAIFSQVVTPPVKAGQTARSKKSSGVFAFIRPARFRFDYQKPYPLTLVADGSMLWWHDVDLAQVTARSQSQALSSSPAALIATASDLAALQKEFHLQDQSEADGLQWVQATPKMRESSIQSVRIGLRVESGVANLEKLDILDAMGQRSVISFEYFEANPKNLSPSQFVFVPPKGVDVVRP